VIKQLFGIGLTRHLPVGFIMLTMENLLQTRLKALIKERDKLVAKAASSASRFKKQQTANRTKAVKGILASLIPVLADHSGPWTALEKKLLKRLPSNVSVFAG
jgi:hypothetical protein